MSRNNAPMLEQITAYDKQIEQKYHINLNVGYINRFEQNYNKLETSFPCFKRSY